MAGRCAETRAVRLPSTARCFFCADASPCWYRPKKVPRRGEAPGRIDECPTSTMRRGRRPLCARGATALPCRLRRRWRGET